MNFSRLAPTMFFLLLLLSAPFFIVQTKNDATGRVLADDFKLFETSTEEDSYLSLNGTNAYVTFGNFNNISKNSNFSIEINAILYEPVGSDGIVFTNVLDNNDRFGIRVNKSTQVIETAIWNGSSYFVNRSQPIIFETEYNIKVTFINNVLTLIVDGVTSTDSGNMSLGEARNRSVIGVRTELSLDWMKLDINYFAVYNGNFATKTNEYLFNELTGTTINDNVGTNHGTAVNTQWKLGQTIITSQNYFDIMENARTAEYANVFGIFQIIREIPMTAQKIITGIERFYNFFPNPISYVEDRLNDMTFSDIGDSWWYNLWQRLRGN
jgi:hypothetical protein